MPKTQIFDGNGDGILCSEYQGIYYPMGPLCDRDIVLRRLLEFQGREDDVIILTYPKSGTHWVLGICNMIISGETKIKKDIKTSFMLELNLPESMDNLPSVRLLNTHVKPELYPTDLIHQKAKIIHILRNPKDVAVSAYFHWKNSATMEYGGTWDGYFPLFIHKNNLFGTWFEHVKAWDGFFKQQQDIPMLQLYFEDLKRDLRSGVKTLSEFLGVERDGAFLDEVTNQCSFENMKKQKPIPETTEWMKALNEQNIFRKGIAGDWKKYFTVAQNETFNEIYEREMKGFSFRFDSDMI